MDVSQCSAMNTDEYGKISFRVMSLLQLAYELQLVEMEELELQSDRAKTIEQAGAACIGKRTD